jgi:6-phosphogluconate dehydrogenase (decarboxylating)
MTPWSKLRNRLAFLAFSLAGALTLASAPAQAVTGRLAIEAAGQKRTAVLVEPGRLKRSPRTAIIMVKAGGPTDAVINDLVQVFEPGDIIVDGGNALFTDTIRREKAVRETGINFVGAGISGGEEGALNGPSIMPGGSAEAWQTTGCPWCRVYSSLE